MAPVVLLLGQCRWRPSGEAGPSPPAETHLFPQFRHKVRFEGMEPLPSRSSSQDSRSLQGATPSAASESSRASTSSSQLDGLSLATSTSDSVELDVEIQQLLSLLQTLLAHFDRANGAAEEVYALECQLESSRRRQAWRRAERPANLSHPVRTAPACPSSEPGPGSWPVLPSRPLSSPAAFRVLHHSGPGAQLTPRKTPVAAAKRKKPLWANNRVHPTGK